MIELQSIGPLNNLCRIQKLYFKEFYIYSYVRQTNELPINIDSIIEN